MRRLHEESFTLLQHTLDGSTLARFHEGKDQRVDEIGKPRTAVAVFRHVERRGDSACQTFEMGFRKEAGADRGVLEQPEQPPPAVELETPPVAHGVVEEEDTRGSAAGCVRTGVVDGPAIPLFTFARR